MGRWQRKAERQIGRATAGNEQVRNAQLQAARDDRNDAISSANSGSAALQALIGQQLQSVRSSRLKGHDRRSAISRLRSQKVQAASQAPYAAQQARGAYQERAQGLDMAALQAEVTKGQQVAQRTVQLRQARQDEKALLSEERQELAEEQEGYRSLGYDEAKYGADELTAARASLDSGLAEVKRLRIARDTDDDEWKALSQQDQEEYAKDLDNWDLGSEEGWYALGKSLGDGGKYPDVDAEEMRKAIYERLGGAGRGTVGSIRNDDLNRSFGYTGF